MPAYRNSELAHNFPSQQLRGDTIDELVGIVERAPERRELTPQDFIDKKAPLKFNAAFIDRRMREHRRWQDHHELVTAAGIVCRARSADRVDGVLR